MLYSREDQIAALKERTLPALRRLGFKGSFPHFYRDQSGHVDLLAFQFSAYGGRLQPEISYVRPDRSELPSELRSLPASKLRTHFTAFRRRLATSDGDDGFAYADPRPGESLRSPAAIADEVTQLLDSQAGPWWEQARVGV